MLGLGPIMAERLQEKQRAEVTVSMADRATWSISMAMAAFVETVTPAVVIGATLFWTRRTEQLSAAEFFSILALVVMVTTPLSALLDNLGYWSAGFASLARIQSYLLQDEMKDYRELIEEPPSSRTSRATASSTGAAIRGGSQSRSRSGRRSRRRIQFAASVSNVAVTYDTSSPVLVDVSLNFPINKKTMIYGTVGCGKTTLLKAPLGEAPVREGEVSVVTKSIAYCSQTPFIRKASIKANIVGPNPYNEAWLVRALWICALNVDLEFFPNGVNTIVGSDGCNLSGGQKQRISLARALYAKAEILLLDDVFSSLDVDTSSEVRVRLFGEAGVLRSSGTTLIMTTSMTPHLVDADHVVGIARGGRAMWLSHPAREVSSQALPASVLPEPEDPDPVVVVEPAPGEKVELPAVEASGKTEAPRYHPTSKYGDLSLYSYFLAPAGGWILVLWTVIVSVAAVAERMPQVYVRIWLEKSPESRFYYLGYVLLGVTSPLCNLLAGSFYFYLVNSRTTEALHWTIADTTFKATLDFLSEEDTGALLNRFSQDITIASQRLPLAIMPASWMAVTVLVDIGIIASGAKYAAPIIPVFLLLLAVIQHYYLQTSRQFRYMELDSSKLLYTHFSETSTGITSIRSFQWEHDAQMQFYEILNAAQKPFYCLLSIQQWLQVVLNMASMAAAVVLVSLALHYTGASSASSMGLALLSLITFSDTMGIFIGTWVDTETGLGAIARTRAFVQTTPVERDKKRMHPLSEKWPATGKVDFSCVSASYQSESETPRTALSNVTFSINAGDKVGIIGRTGSGKSSLLSGLLSLMEYSGSISIDDREVRGVPRDVLRRRLTTITQSGLQLRGSVRFNLNPFSFASAGDDALVRALDRVGLLQLVDTRGGIDADTVDMRLSQGEKQLFQIARAIVHKQCTEARLVLIDEGSASMDEDTERHVQRIIDKEFADCTVLIVSHRPTALGSVNVLLRLDAGELTMFRVNQQTGQLTEVRPWED